MTDKPLPGLSQTIGEGKVQMITELACDFPSSSFPFLPTPRDHPFGVTPCRGFYSVGKMVRVTKNESEGMWFVLEKKASAGSGTKPIGTRFIQSLHYGRDRKEHAANGWKFVSAIFVPKKKHQKRLYKILSGKGRKKVRGLISKTSVFDNFAKRHFNKLYTSFNKVFGFKCEHLIIRVSNFPKS